ncbi:PEP-CTERM sorting domain-containing protein [Methylicorpusculum oleiharenae]|uniref:PEP-CTERM sorting domain-containing protein n=1 Tax=Methylicorpusculum oleiharenae TaxID=1338687 RepID=UPI00135B69A6|nr:PEP-CTERM sorting domain-containing protein [Methylicorpusculum oleiharenae]MCD2449905.1 PEP-CTERM sorting domain-containing protein [Methylicorpusculum oleiharenae]
MNKKILAAALLPFCILTGINANAAYIETSASSTSFSDSYSYTFKITNTSDSSIYNAILSNTSTSPSTSLIDLLAFNLNPNLVLGTDFNIINVSPVWNFSAASGGIQFDYLGERSTPESRLSPGESLTFDFKFLTLSLLPTDPFDLWRNSERDRGTGIGGGDDSGQVAVSFQQLGSNGNSSDLLASNWGPVNPDDPNDPNDPNVPEPTSLLLMAFGLLGFGASRMKGKAA